MKRLLTALSLFILLSLTAIYIFIPRNIIISKVVLINCNVDGATRILLQPDNWRKSGVSNNGHAVLDSAVSDNSFEYKGTYYTIIKKLQNSINVLINSRNYKTNSTITILPLAQDSIAIQWRSNIITGLNPVKKIQSYQHAISIKKDMTDILSNMQSFLEKKENVYGLNIQKTSTTDTLLVAAKSVSPVYPATPVIYKSVKLLQDYIVKKGAIQTGAPMINITKLNKDEFQLMVAVPTNMPLKDEGNIFLRKMVRGNFLVTEVRGGIYTVNEAMNNMELYISDYKKTAMAIPFQSLVTDRSKEADTSKWITKIYFPIYY